MKYLNFFIFVLQFLSELGRGSQPDRQHDDNFAAFQVPVSVPPVDTCTPAAVSSTDVNCPRIEGLNRSPTSSTASTPPVPPIRADFDALLASGHGSFLAMKYLNFFIFVLQFLSELGRGSQPDRQHDDNFAAFQVPVSVPPVDTCTPAAVSSTDVNCPRIEGLNRSPTSSTASTPPVPPIRADFDALLASGHGSFLAMKYLNFFIFVLQFLSELGRGSQPDRQHDDNFAAFQVPVSVPPVDTCTPAAVSSTDVNCPRIEGLNRSPTSSTASTPPVPPIRADFDALLASGHGSFLAMKYLNFFIFVLQFLSELGRGSQPDRQHDDNFAAFQVPVSVPPVDTCTPAAVSSTDVNCPRIEGLNRSPTSSTASTPPVPPIRADFDALLASGHGSFLAMKYLNFFIFVLQFLSELGRGSQPDRQHDDNFAAFQVPVSVPPVDTCTPAAVSSTDVNCPRIEGLNRSPTSSTASTPPVPPIRADFDALLASGHGSFPAMKYLNFFIFVLQFLSELGRGSQPDRQHDDNFAAFQVPVSVPPVDTCTPAAVSSTDVNCPRIEGLNRSPTSSTASTPPVPPIRADFDALLASGHGSFPAMKYLNFFIFVLQFLSELGRGSQPDRQHDDNFAAFQVPVSVPPVDTCTPAAVSSTDVNCPRIEGLNRSPTSSTASTPPVPPIRADFDALLASGHGSFPAMKYLNFFIFVLQFLSELGRGSQPDRQHDDNFAAFQVPVSVPPVDTCTPAAVSSTDVNCPRIEGLNRSPTSSTASTPPVPPIRADFDALLASGHGSFPAMKYLNFFIFVLQFLSELGRGSQPDRQHDDNFAAFQVPVSVPPVDTCTPAAVSSTDVNCPRIEGLNRSPTSSTASTPPVPPIRADFDALLASGHGSFLAMKYLNFFIFVLQFLSELGRGSQPDRQHDDNFAAFQVPVSVPPVDTCTPAAVSSTDVNCPRIEGLNRSPTSSTASTPPVPPIRADFDALLASGHGSFPAMKYLNFFIFVLQFLSELGRGSQPDRQHDDNFAAFQVPVSVPPVDTCTPAAVSSTDVNCPRIEGLNRSPTSSTASTPPVPPIRADFDALLASGHGSFPAMKYLNFFIFVLQFLSELGRGSQPDRQHDDNFAAFQVPVSVPPVDTCTPAAVSSTDVNCPRIEGLNRSPTSSTASTPPVPPIRADFDALLASGHGSFPAMKYLNFFIFVLQFLSELGRGSQPDRQHDDNFAAFQVPVSVPPVDTCTPAAVSSTDVNCPRIEGLNRSPTSSTASTPPVPPIRADFDALLASGHGSFPAMKYLNFFIFVLQFLSELGRGSQPDRQHDDNFAAFQVPVSVPPVDTCTPAAVSSTDVNCPRIEGLNRSPTSSTASTPPVPPIRADFDALLASGHGSFPAMKYLNFFIFVLQFLSELGRGSQPDRQHDDNFAAFQVPVSVPPVDTCTPAAVSSTDVNCPRIEGLNRSPTSSTASTPPVPPIRADFDALLASGHGSFPAMKYLNFFIFVLQFLSELGRGSQPDRQHDDNFAAFQVPVSVPPVDTCTPAAVSSTDVNCPRIEGLNRSPTSSTASTPPVPPIRADFDALLASGHGSFPAMKYLNFFIFVLQFLSELGRGSQPDRQHDDNFAAFQVPVSVPPVDTCTPAAVSSTDVNCPRIEGLNRSPTSSTASTPPVPPIRADFDALLASGHGSFPAMKYLNFFIFVLQFLSELGRGSQPDRQHDDNFAAFQVPVSVPPVDTCTPAAVSSTDVNCPRIEGLNRSPTSSTASTPPVPPIRADFDALLASGHGSFPAMKYLNFFIFVLQFLSELGRGSQPDRQHDDNFAAFQVPVSVPPVDTCTPAAVSSTDVNCPRIEGLNRSPTSSTASTPPVPPIRADFDALLASGHGSFPAMKYLNFFIFVLQFLSELGRGSQPDRQHDDNFAAFQVPVSVPPVDTCTPAAVSSTDVNCPRIEGLNRSPTSSTASTPPVPPIRADFDALLASGHGSFPAMKYLNFFIFVLQFLSELGRGSQPDRQHDDNFAAFQVPVSVPPVDTCTPAAVSSTDVNCPRIEGLNRSPTSSTASTPPVPPIRADFDALLASGHGSFPAMKYLNFFIFVLQFLSELGRGSQPDRQHDDNFAAFQVPVSVPPVDTCTPAAVSSTDVNCPRIEGLNRSPTSSTASTPPVPPIRADFDALLASGHGSFPAMKYLNFFIFVLQFLSELGRGSQPDRQHDDNFAAFQVPVSVPPVDTCTPAAVSSTDVNCPRIEGLNRSPTSSTASTPPVPPIRADFDALLASGHGSFPAMKYLNFFIFVLQFLSELGRGSQPDRQHDDNFAAFQVPVSVPPVDTCTPAAVSSTDVNCPRIEGLNRSPTSSTASTPPVPPIRADFDALLASGHGSFPAMKYLNFFIFVLQFLSELGRGSQPDRQHDDNFAAFQVPVSVPPVDTCTPAAVSSTDVNCPRIEGLNRSPTSSTASTPPVPPIRADFDALLASGHGSFPAMKYLNFFIFVLQFLSELGRGSQPDRQHDDNFAAFQVPVSVPPVDTCTPAAVSSTDVNCPRIEGLNRSPTSSTASTPPVPPIRADFDALLASGHGSFPAMKYLNFFIFVLQFLSELGRGSQPDRQHDDNFAAFQVPVSVPPVDTCTPAAVSSTDVNCPRIEGLNRSPTSSTASTPPVPPIRADFDALLASGHGSFPAMKYLNFFIFVLQFLSELGRGSQPDRQHDDNFAAFQVPVSVPPVDTCTPAAVSSTDVNCPRIEGLNRSPTSSTASTPPVPPIRADFDALLASGHGSFPAMKYLNFFIFVLQFLSELGRGSQPDRQHDDNFAAFQVPVSVPPVDTCTPAAVSSTDVNCPRIEGLNRSPTSSTASTPPVPPIRADFDALLASGHGSFPAMKYLNFFIFVLQFLSELGRGSQPDRQHDDNFAAFQVPVSVPPVDTCTPAAVSSTDVNCPRIEGLNRSPTSSTASTPPVPPIRADFDALLASGHGSFPAMKYLNFFIFVLQFLSELGRGSQPDRQHDDNFAAFQVPVSVPPVDTCTPAAVSSTDVNCPRIEGLNRSPTSSTASTPPVPPIRADFDALLASGHGSFPAMKYLNFFIFVLQFLSELGRGSQPDRQHDDNFAAFQVPVSVPPVDTCTPAAVSSTDVNCPRIEGLNRSPTSSTASTPPVPPIRADFDALLASGHGSFPAMKYLNFFIFVLQFLSELGRGSQPDRQHDDNFAAFQVPVSVPPVDTCTPAAVSSTDVNCPRIEGLNRSPTSSTASTPPVPPIRADFDALLASGHGSFPAMKYLNFFIFVLQFLSELGRGSQPDRQHDDNFAAFQVPVSVPPVDTCTPAAVSSTDVNCPRIEGLNRSPTSSTASTPPVPPIRADFDALLASGHGSFPAMKYLNFFIFVLQFLSELGRGSQPDRQHDDNFAAFQVPVSVPPVDTCTPAAVSSTDVNCPRIEGLNRSPTSSTASTPPVPPIRADFDALLASGHGSFPAMKYLNFFIFVLQFLSELGRGSQPDRQHDDNFAAFQVPVSVPPVDTCTPAAVSSTDVNCPRIEGLNRSPTSSTASTPPVPPIRADFDALLASGHGSFPAMKYLNFFIFVLQFLSELGRGSQPDRQHDDNFAAFQVPVSVPPVDTCTPAAVSSTDVNCPRIEGLNRSPTSSTASTPPVPPIRADFDALLASGHGSFPAMKYLNFFIFVLQFLSELGRGSQPDRQHDDNFAAFQVPVSVPPVDTCTPAAVSSTDVNCPCIEGLNRSPTSSTASTPPVPPIRADFDALLASGHGSFPAMKYLNFFIFVLQFLSELGRGSQPDRQHDDNFAAFQVPVSVPPVDTCTPAAVSSTDVNCPRIEGLNRSPTSSTASTPPVPPIRADFDALLASGHGSFPAMKYLNFFIFVLQFLSELGRGSQPDRQHDDNFAAFQVPVSVPPVDTCTPAAVSSTDVNCPCIEGLNRSPTSSTASTPPVPPIRADFDALLASGHGSFPAMKYLNFFIFVLQFLSELGRGSQPDRQHDDNFAAFQVPVSVPPVDTCTPAAVSSTDVNCPRIEGLNRSPTSSTASTPPVPPIRADFDALLASGHGSFPAMKYLNFFIFVLQFLSELGRGSQPDRQHDDNFAAFQVPVSVPPVDTCTPAAVSSTDVNCPCIEGLNRSPTSSTASTPPVPPIRADFDALLASGHGSFPAMKYLNFFIFVLQFLSELGRGSQPDRQHDDNFAAFQVPGQTVNKEFYCEVLKRLRNRVRRVRKEICDNWILHHGNASSHTALIVSELLAKMCVPTLPEPPYSPDLAPPDFFLFPRIKRTLKGTRHGTLETVKAAATTSLKEVPVDGFQGAFSDWVQRWQQCIEAGGDYLEKF
ncbi:putative histone-lysine N-methyltransferase SETMAR-like [Ixodes scapularis]